MKQKIALIFTAILLILGTGCAPKEFDPSSEITIVSREDGSGTRGAFIELFDIEVKGPNGTRSDKTTKEALIANKTDVMMTNVSGDPYAIGYISLGSLNNSVKPVKVDGVEGTAETIKDGTYKVARPFNVATKGEPAGLARDFLNYVFSAEGQKIVARSYIAIDDQAPPYSGSKPSGKIVVAGSSSVAPVMEKLIEGYQEINPNAQIELQSSDSTTGMAGAIEGTCDIGMASRNLKESEKQILQERTIAMDGIIIVVNNQNPVSDLTSQEIKGIYTGTIQNWSTLTE